MVVAVKNMLATTMEKPQSFRIRKSSLPAVFKCLVDSADISYDFDDASDLVSYRFVNSSRKAE